MSSNFSITPCIMIQHSQLSVGYESAYEVFIQRQGWKQSERGKGMGHGRRIEWVDIVKCVCIIMVMLSCLVTRTDIWSTFYSPSFLTAFFFTAEYAYRPKGIFRGTAQRCRGILSICSRQCSTWFLAICFGTILKDCLTDIIL